MKISHINVNIYDKTANFFTCFYSNRNVWNPTLIVWRYKNIAFFRILKKMKKKNKSINQ
jgi:hypothetical protein